MSLIITKKDNTLDVSQSPRTLRQSSKIQIYATKYRESVARVTSLFLVLGQTVKSKASNKAKYSVLIPAQFCRPASAQSYQRDPLIRDYE